MTQMINAELTVFKLRRTNKETIDPEEQKFKQINLTRFLLVSFSLSLISL